MAIFLARSSVDKPEIKKQIEERIGYNLDETVDSIRTWYHFDVSCQGTVTQAITCFLESESYEETIRKTASLGGDRDTLACIAGGIAELITACPISIIKEASSLLPEDIKTIIRDFYGIAELS
jgi:ADP-ribosylglycohydrolase